jgi:Na+/proline symporter
MHPIDIAIIALYMLLMIAVGWAVMRLAARSSESYFLAGKSLPWWLIGIAHGSSGVDITGTIWFVMMLYVYGVKAVWLLWVWPLFNVLFRMVYLGAWVRRSNVLTGAEWMRTRFGYGVGAELGYLSVVVYAMVSVVGFLSYAFRGIGDFVVPFMPFGSTFAFELFGQSYEVAAGNVYATVILLVTGLYCVVGGMYSVVLNDVIQFVLICVAAVVIAVVAMSQTTHSDIMAAVPAGWDELIPSGVASYDWGEKGLPALDARINSPPSQGGDGYVPFSFFVAMLLMKGVAVSMAGPTPNYAIQHVLSTRSPREAALENFMMCIASLLPRFLFIAGIAVLGLVFFKGDMQVAIEKAGQSQRQRMAASADNGKPLTAEQIQTAVRKAENDAAKREIEAVLPNVVKHGNYVPVGLKGIILAGLLAAFMSTFVSTVNSGAAYVVNDVYKRYVNPAASQRRLVMLGYLASVAVILLGIGFGFTTDRVHSVTKWIVSALVPGFVPPNVLKWHWWRFNGFGFFAGMLAGTVASVAIPLAVPGLHDVALFMSVLGISTLASVAVCLATPPDGEDVLKSFYRTVRPWGFWGPILRKCRADNPAIEPNRDFRRDAMNILISLVWQTAMVALPIYLVIQSWTKMLVCLSVFVVTSVILKFTWYDNLGPGEMYLDDAVDAPNRETT